MDTPAMHRGRHSATPASQAHLGLGAPVLFPLTTAVQVAPPLLAGRPLTVDVVVVQKVSGTAAELPLRTVGLAGARRLRRKAHLSRRPLRCPPRSPIHPLPGNGLS